MLRPSKSYLQEALTNNTFDMACTEHAIINGLNQSFSYLYRLQRNMVDFEESYYTTRNVIDQQDFGDFYLDDNEYVCLNLPGEIVTQSFRENYRQSDYFDKELSYDTLNEYHDTMFTRFPVLFIDEGVVRHPMFEIKDDYFHVRTEERRDFLLKKTFDKNRWEYEYKNHTACLQLVGHSYYQEIVTNASMLQVQSRSYDLLKADYLAQFKFHGDESPGTYFVTAFLGDDTIGTPLADCEFEASGNLRMHFGSDDLEKIKACRTDITLRIYFYQYCFPYTSFHNSTKSYANRYVRTMKRDNEYETELIAIEDETGLYPMPVATENLMLFKVKKDDVVSSGYKKRYHMPADKMKISYPNIYRQVEDLEEGDRIRLFYFYVPDGRSRYNYHYTFFRKYLESITGLTYEVAINNLWFCTNLTTALTPMASAVLVAYLQASGQIEKSNPQYVYSTINQQLSMTVPINSVIESVTRAPITNAPSYDDPELYRIWGPFGSEFFRIVFADYADYFYDEFDYMRKFEDKHPIEYKIEKLKNFISDDPNIFLSYVKEQDTLPIKYSFQMNAKTIADRIREMDVAGNYFTEDMVEFAITSPYIDDEVTGRVFINGLYASMSIFYHYADSEYIYVPLRYVTEDSYVEVEVLPKYIKKIPLKFTTSNDHVVVELGSNPILYPTLNDIEIVDKSTGNVVDRTNIAYSVIDDEINYIDEEKDGVTIYYEKRLNGTIDRTHYYSADGSYYTSDGFRKPELDISKDNLLDQVVIGTIVQSTGTLCNNQYLILLDNEYVTYDDVFAGTSIINRENKGVNFSNTSKLLLQPTDGSLYDTELELEIEKDPGYLSSVIQSSTYPVYTFVPKDVPHPLDYVRVFKNGRLMCQSKYMQTFDTQTGGAIQMLDRFDKGDRIVFDITPYYNRLIYYRDTIESGLIDLNGFIDKPFDFRFYEIYLNGRRLNTHQVKPISPYEIQLNHIHSLHNLAIFERERDWEYYFSGFEQYHTLSDFIRYPFIDSDMKKDLIEWTIGEPIDVSNDENVMDWGEGMKLYSIFFDIFYHTKLLPLGLASGDLVQWEKEYIETNYGDIYEAFHKTNELGEDVLLLSPDDFCAEEKATSTPEELEARSWEVYMMGNTDMSLIDNPLSES